MSQINTNAILDASGGTTATVNGFAPTVSNMAGRNRIINGDMRIDQRNNGASATPADGQYVLDRWQNYLTQASKFSVQRNAGAVTPPSGFTNYLGVTSLSAYSVLVSDIFAIGQQIEGFNTADLAWGTASAKTTTLSFWVRSSLTGTFGGSLTNSAQNRFYPFSYSISAANTWEQKTVTIAGDTSGTWATDNTVGIRVRWSLGVGSNNSGAAGSWGGTSYWSATGATSVVGTSGATFYITGVQLEEGSVATPFEHRQYGQELALCQRYYWKNSPDSPYGWIASGRNQSGYVSLLITNPVSMRASPTFIISNLGASDGTPTGALTGTYAGVLTSLLQATFTGQSGGIGTFNNIQQNGTPSSGYLSASSEL